MTPQRIQLKRTKGWRKPDGAILVSRPSRWGNPFVVERVDERYPPRYQTAGTIVVRATDNRGHRTGPQWGGFGHDRAAAIAFAVELYRRSLEATFEDVDGALNRSFYLDELRGHDLACWCPLSKPCHADVLLELANGVSGE